MRRKVQDIKATSFDSVSLSLKLQFRRLHQFYQNSRLISFLERNLFYSSKQTTMANFLREAQQLDGEYAGGNNNNNNNQQGGGNGGMMQEAERFMESNSNDNNNNSGNMGGTMDRQREENTDRNDRDGDSGGRQQQGGSSSGGGFGGILQGAETAGAMGMVNNGELLY